MGQLNLTIKNLWNCIFEALREFGVVLVVEERGQAVYMIYDDAPNIPNCLHILFPETVINAISSKSKTNNRYLLDATVAGQLFKGSICQDQHGALGKYKKVLKLFVQGGTSVLIDERRHIERVIRDSVCAHKYRQKKGVSAYRVSKAEAEAGASDLEEYCSAVTNLLCGQLVQLIDGLNRQQNAWLLGILPSVDRNNALYLYTALLAAAICEMTYEQELSEAAARKLAVQLETLRNHIVNFLNLASDAGGEEGQSASADKRPAPNPSYDNLNEENVGKIAEQQERNLLKERFQVLTDTIAQNDDVTAVIDDLERTCRRLSLKASTDLAEYWISSFAALTSDGTRFSKGIYLRLVIIHISLIIRRLEGEIKDLEEKLSSAKKIDQRIESLQLALEDKKKDLYLYRGDRRAYEQELEKFQNADLNRESIIRLNLLNQQGEKRN